MKVFLIVALLVGGLSSPAFGQATAWKTDTFRLRGEVTSVSYTAQSCVVMTAPDSNRVVLGAGDYPEEYEHHVYWGQIEGGNLKAKTMSYSTRPSNATEPAVVNYDLFDKLCKKKLPDLPAEVQKLFGKNYGLNQ